MMKKSMLVIVIILFVLLGVLVMYYGDIRAIIDGVEYKSCDIPFGGGSCVVNVTMDEGVMASLYSLDLDFDKVPAGFYVDEQVISHVDYVITKEEDEDSDSYEVETFHNYLYDLPWSNDIISSLNITASTCGTCRTNEDQDSKVKVYIAYVTIDYPHDSFTMCDSDSGSECPDDTILHYYRYDGLCYHRLYNLNMIDEWQVVRCYGLDGDVPESENKCGSATGVVEGSALKDNFRLYAHVEVESENGGSVSATLPPIFTVSYEPVEYPSNLMYGVDGEPVETLDGLQTGQVHTYDIAEQMNAYCGRDGSSISECVVPITFSSDTGGQVVLVDIDETWKIAELNPDVACGDGVCDDDEDEYTCEIDCKDDGLTTQTKVIIGGSGVAGLLGLIFWRRWF